MGEMHDRVARTMCDAIGPLGVDCTCNPGTCLVPETRRIAKLVLDALREPTDAMLKAAVNNLETDLYADIWREMIDAEIEDEADAK